MGTARRPLRSGEWLAVIAFGKLLIGERRLLADAISLGIRWLCSLESAEQLGAIIAKQDGRRKCPSYLVQALRELAFAWLSFGNFCLPRPLAAALPGPGP